MTPKKLKMSTPSSAVSNVDNSDADEREIKLPENIPDILIPYAGIHIIFKRRKASFYSPSSLMMDYILHHVNSCLVDNSYFVRSCPDYHPYILRLYYGVLFWIQILRSNIAAASAASVSDVLFLEYFCKSHPPDSLPISGPLMPIFNSLCASRPEIESFGFICPILHTPPGVPRRSDFFRPSSSWGMLPNVPGIFALLEHLNSLINAEEPFYPSKGQHTPITETSPADTVFGHHSFPAAAQRSDNQKWALCSSGLQYPCEADDRLNQAFAEHYDDFDFPATEANDDLTQIFSFLSMDDQSTWFSHVKSVAAQAADCFEGSGTLADCDASVCSANQFVVCYERPATPPPAPRFSADPRSLFPFSFKLQTSVRNPPPLSEAIASVAQTNVLMFADHPKYGTSTTTSLIGEFWDIRPNEFSPVNRNLYLDLPRAVMKMMKDKV